MSETTHAEQVQFLSELPESVLDAFVRRSAWWQLDDTFNDEDCAYCESMMGVEQGEDLEPCGHWQCLLNEVLPAIHAIHAALAKEDQGLLSKAERGGPYEALVGRAFLSITKKRGKDGNYVGITWDMVYADPKAAEDDEDEEFDNIPF